MAGTIDQKLTVLNHRALVAANASAQIAQFVQGHVQPLFADTDLLLTAAQKLALRNKLDTLLTAAIAAAALIPPNFAGFEPTQAEIDALPPVNPVP